MDWYSWATLAAFNAWHARAKAALGLPKVGYNAETGEPEPESQWTTDYTASYVVAPGDVRAYVEPAAAALVPLGLGTPCDTPPPIAEEP